MDKKAVWIYLLGYTYTSPQNASPAWLWQGIAHRKPSKSVAIAIANRAESIDWFLACPGYLSCLCFC